jgi:hypothetical protein
MVAWQEERISSSHIQIFGIYVTYYELFAENIS